MPNDEWSLAVRSLTLMRDEVAPQLVVKEATDRAAGAICESLAQAGRSVTTAVILDTVGLPRHNLNPRTTVMTDDKIALRALLEAACADPRRHRS